MAGGECDFHNGCGRPFVSVPLCALTHCKSSKKKRALCKFENTYLLWVLQPTLVLQQHPSIMVSSWNGLQNRAELVQIHAPSLLLNRMQI